MRHRRHRDAEARLPVQWSSHELSKVLACHRIAEHGLLDRKPRRFHELTKCRQWRVWIACCSALHRPVRIFGQPGQYFGVRVRCFGKALAHGGA